MNSTPLVIQYTILSNKWGAVHKVSLPTLIKIANSLHCTLDQLVMDSLEASSPLYLHTISQALTDCTQEELGVAEDVLKALLSSLRSHTPKEL